MDSARFPKPGYDSSNLSEGTRVLNMLFRSIALLPQEWGMRGKSGLPQRASRRLRSLNYRDMVAIQTVPGNSLPIGAG